MTVAAEKTVSRYDSVVINLDRQPDRLADFRRWNDNTGLTIERFPAIEGKALEAETGKSISTIAALPKGALGAAASHKALWERSRTAGRQLVVFEDDAILRHDIKTRLPDVIHAIGGFWDIVLLGFNTDASVIATLNGQFVDPVAFPKYPSRAYLQEFQLRSEVPAPARLLNAFGLCAYAISPRGAQRLLQMCFPIDNRLLRPVGHPPLRVFGIDSMMNAFYGSLDAYVCFPPLAMTPNDQSTSTTR